jgi:hypothetical protein
MEMKIKMLLIAAMLVVLSGVSEAALITDTNLSDNNDITGQSIQPNRDLFVDETYGEQTLTAYSSQLGGGLAVVNGNYESFDKIINMQSEDFYDEDEITFLFTIRNDGPHVWHGYHFEFWNTDFTQRSAVSAGGWPGGTAHFPNSVSDLDDYAIRFWGGTVQPGEEVVLPFTIYTMTLEQYTSFGIRQVATTIPIPGAVWLLGSGVIALIGLRKKLKN